MVLRSGWASARKRITDTHPLVLILLLAAIARFWGLGFSLPYLYRPDEPKIVGHALGFFTGDRNPHFFNYPALHMYFLYAIFHLYLWAAAALGLLAQPQDVHLLLFANPTTPYLLARAVSATMGLATVFLVFWLASKAYSHFEGLAAAFFLGLTFLHARDSHFATLEVPLTFLITLAHLPMLRLLRAPQLRHYLTAGLLTGLAAATKYSGAWLLAPLITAHLLARREHRRSPSAPRAVYLAAALLVSGLAFSLASPYCLIEWRSFVDALRYESRHMMAGHGTGAQLAIGFIHNTVFSLRHGMGLPLLALALFGAVCCLRRRRSEDLLLLSFPVGYYLVMASWRTVFVRYSTPLLPFLALWAAIGLHRLLKPLEQERGPIRAITGVVVSILVVIPPATSIIAHNSLLCRVDTRISALQWITDNLPSGAALALPPYGPQGFRTQLATKPELRLEGQRFRLPESKASGPRAYRLIMMKDCSYDIDALRREGAQYLVAQHAYSPDSPWTAPPNLASREGLRLLEVISPFHPDAAPRPLWDTIDAYFLPYARFGGVQRPGPTIEIYAISSAP